LTGALRGDDLLARAVETLETAGVDPARLQAEWLLAGVLGVPRFHVYLTLDRELGADVAREFAARVRRRAAGEPLQQVLGWEEFRGLRLRVSPDVLVPRPETEVLVDLALDLLPAPGGARPLVVDVGSGSGCVAVAIASERPDVVSRGNIGALALASRARVVVADVLSALRADSADLIVSNPPYLPAPLFPGLPREVREWEPPMALLAGDDGLAVLRPLIIDARRVLKPGAALVVETAGEMHVNAVVTLFRDAGYAEVDVRHDLTGTRRFVSGRAPNVTAKPPSEG
jgi:release factor glutamine methyltransferase